VEFDYIIVGGGTAGCVLANRLSANPKARVLLLEAGKSDNYHWVHVPIGYLYCIGNPRTDWMMKTAAEPGLNGRALSYPRGKVLGGCSSVNGMIYMRGQAADYDGWRQMGMRAGAGMMSCRISCAARITMMPVGNCTSLAANGKCRASGCGGMCWKRCRRAPKSSA